ncbi:uncharacterized protein TNCV_4621921 [Trichonephila clavipes]|nr:uncharacterized protein TNCV_4621921 [Trichonephila clavipes]
MRDFTYAENAGTHYMYGRANEIGSAALRMYHAQFLDRRMPDHRIFQRLQRHLRETRSFHVNRHDASQRCLSLEESILNVVVDRPESSARAVAHLELISTKPVFRISLLNNRDIPAKFQVSSYLSFPFTNLTRRLVVRRLFRVPPMPQKGTIDLQTSMSSKAVFRNPGP